MTKKHKEIKHKTHMIKWRGGNVEFVDHDNCGLNESYMAHPPWYVVAYTGGPWENDVNYIWIDYCGPPEVFLSKRQATIAARAFRKQYNAGEERWEHSQVRAWVVKLEPRNQ